MSKREHIYKSSFKTNKRNDSLLHRFFQLQVQSCSHSARVNHVHGCELMGVLALDPCREPNTLVWSQLSCLALPTNMQNWLILTAISRTFGSLERCWGEPALWQKQGLTFMSLSNHINCWTKHSRFSVTSRKTSTTIRVHQKHYDPLVLVCVRQALAWHHVLAERGSAQRHSGTAAIQQLYEHSAPGKSAESWLSIGVTQWGNPPAHLCWN